MSRSRYTLLIHWLKKNISSVSRTCASGVSYYISSSCLLNFRQLNPNLAWPPIDIRFNVNINLFKSPYFTNDGFVEGQVKLVPVFLTSFWHKWKGFQRYLVKWLSVEALWVLLMFLTTEKIFRELALKKMFLVESYKIKTTNSKFLKLHNLSRTINVNLT